MATRLSKLRSRLSEQGLEAMLVTNPLNRAYMSGFNGSAGVLLISQDTALLFTDFRYIERATAQAPEYKVIRHATPMSKSIQEALAEHGIKQLGYEQDHVTVGSYEGYRTAFSGVELVPTSGLIEGLRQYKDADELDKMRRAAAIADAAYIHILKYIKAGVTERDVALELEFFMRKNGAEKLAFDVIPASGPRGSLPHAEATGRVLQDGDLITMDFGCVYEGYCSDITRTVGIGNISDKQREIYRIVLDAQLAALKACRAGISGRELDAVARDIITEAGYGENFGHSLGHGVGREVHELPRSSPTADGVLEPNMIVTIEPGIYIPDWGGVRIEDTVVVLPDGCERLTKSTKELIVL
ncbi:MAG: M24 family metallopeptidase [Chloroflexota bacterium]